MLSINQLRTFLEAARCGSIQDAADALAVTQPAVSAAVAALQRSVGVRLIERDGRKIKVTEAGKCFESYGRRVVAMLEEGQRRAREVAQTTSSRVGLAAVTTAAEHLVPQLLQKFRECRPEVVVDLDVGNHEHVWDRLQHWEVDLVIAGRPPQGSPLRTVATRKHEMIVIAPVGHKFAPDSLRTSTWLVREPGSGTRAVTEECFVALGIDPPRISIASNGAIGACVSAGMGCSLVSRDGVNDALQSGAVQEVATAFTPLNRQWHLVVSIDHDLSPAAKAFVDFAVGSGAFAG